MNERRRQWHPTPVLLTGKSHGRRSMVGFSPWGREELDTTEQLHFRFSLSSIGEENGNPLQYSCLENPRDGGAWWAAVYGVAQSRTRLKRLSSSSSSRVNEMNVILVYHSLSPILSSRSFIILHFILRSVIYFDLIFGKKFFFLHVDVQLQCHLYLL